MRCCEAELTMVKYGVDCCLTHTPRTPMAIFIYPTTHTKSVMSIHPKVFHGVTGSRALISCVEKKSRVVITT